MSYLARMLTRAGVIAQPDVASAAPRLPSWFEPVVEDTAGLPEVEAVDVDTSPAAEGPIPGAPAESPERAKARETRAVEAGRQTRQPSPAAAPVAPAPTSVRSPVEAAAATARREAPAALAQQQPESQPRVRAAATEPEAASRATSAPPPATPAEPLRPPAAPAPAAQHPAPAPEIVHVTIGRVEVRATIAAPPPTPPSRAEQPVQGPPVLSLADFLGGKREAR